MLSYDQMKDNPKVLLAFTGHTQAEFEEILGAFIKASYQMEHKRRAKQKRKRRAGGGRKAQLKTKADQLLFILFYLKTYPIQEVLAFLFDMSQGQANEWIHRLAKVLKRALDDLGHLPERDGTRLAAIVRENETVAFTQDGSERRRQRPKEHEKQKAYYSGKKKAHTVKNHLVVHPESRRVCYLSATSPGKKHDKKLADESDLHFPDRALLEQDTGFQGFGPEQVIILQPKKKPRGKTLSVGEQFINRCISSGRVIAENVIAGIKRCHIVKDVLRNWKSDFDDLIMELACGLHNLRVAHRSPMESVNLIDFYFQ
jgi:DDE superfamily endonuclease/Helix-turn-helix of DDE superfamily endonuclease